MRTGANLDHGHDAQQPALHLNIALDDDCIRQKRRAVRAETQIGVTIFQLRGHQDTDPGIGQRRDHARQRLAKILAKGRRHCQFEARQRVDDHASGFQPSDLAEQQLDNFVNREIGSATIHQTDLPARNQTRQGRILRVIGPLFEYCDHAGFAIARAFGEEGRREDAFTRPRWPGH